MRYELIEAKQGIQYVIRQIKKREIFIGFKLITGERGVVGAYLKTQRTKYSMKFQKKVFNKFNFMQGNKLIHSQGIAFPSKLLYECYDDNMIPMVCLADKRIFITTASKWLDWSIQHHTPDYPVIIKTEDRKVKTDNLTYYNIDINELTPY